MVTHKAPLEKGIGFQQQLSYDEGYDQPKSTTTVDASNGIIGGRFTYSKTDAKDYKIKGDEDKKLAIAQNNDLNSESASFIETKDLGYSSESSSARISAQTGNDSAIDIDWENWTGKDMALIHGSTISDAAIVQYDRMDRNLQAIAFRKDTLGDLNDFHIKYAKQSQFQAIGSIAQGVTLNSQQLNLISDLVLDNLMIKFGGEIIYDNAETLVYSEQDYYGAFSNLEYLIQNWTIFGGVRWNQWTTTQKLLDGANEEVASQLVGISGSTPPKEHAAPPML